MAYHGGVSWHFSGIDFQKRSEFVIADVLDAPFDPSPKVIAALKNAGLQSLCKESPPTQSEPLIDALANARNLDKKDVLVSSGSSSILFSILPRIVKPGGKALLLNPTYSEYAHVLEKVIGTAVEYVDVNTNTYGHGEKVLQELTKRACSGDYNGIFLVNPNSPTGTALPALGLERLASVMAEQVPETFLWIDECYVDFMVENKNTMAMTTMEPAVAKGINRNLLICKSLSKIFALSGLRVAYLVGKLCDELRQYIPPWSVSLPAQVATIAALEDSHYYRNCYRKVSGARHKLVRDLQSHGFDVSNSVANFICLYRRKEIDAAEIVERCRVEHGVFLRFVNSSVLRVAVRCQSENKRIVAAIRAAVNADDKGTGSKQGAHRRGLGIGTTCPAILLLAVLLWALSFSSRNEEVKALTSALVISPGLLLLLRVTVRESQRTSKELTPLHIHQLFCTIIWTSALFGGWGPGITTSNGSLENFRFFGFTLGAFFAELEFVWSDSPSLRAHHIFSVLVIVVGVFLGLSDDRVVLGTGVNLVAVAAPSYTCIPKLARRSEMFSPETVNMLWCMALLCWIFVRLLLLQLHYGVGFQKIKLMVCPHWANETWSPSTYWSSAVCTVSLGVIYAINCFWAIKKCQSVVKIINEYFRLKIAQKIGERDACSDTAVFETKRWNVPSAQ